MSDKPKYTLDDMAAEAMLYGSAFSITKADGSLERIEPFSLTEEHLAYIEKHGWGAAKAILMSREEAEKLFGTETRK